MKFHRCLFVLSLKLEMRNFTSKSCKNAKEMFYKVWFTCKVIVLPVRPLFALLCLLVCFVLFCFFNFSLPPSRWIFKFLMFTSNTGSDVIWRLDVGVKWTCMLDGKANGRSQWILFLCPWRNHCSQGYKYEDLMLLQSHDRKEGDPIRLHGACASHCMV